jgi:O-antigen/teichoic acid export membrane protein
LTAKVTGGRVLKDWLVSIGAEVVTAGSNLASGILLARAVGADGKGVFALMMTVSAMAAAVLGLRWERPAGHFLARDRRALPVVLTSIGAVTGIATGLAALALSLTPAPAVDALLHGLDPSIVALVWWLVGAQCLYVGIAAVYGGLRDFAARSRFLLAYNALQALVVFLLFLSGEARVATYLRWYALTGWAVGIGWLAVLARRDRLVPRLEWELLRRMASFGSRSYLALLLDLVTVRLDLILLNFFSSAAAVGVYSVAVAVGARLASIPQIVAYVVFHRTSARELGSGEWTAQILRAATLVMAGAGLVVALIGAVLIVPLYGAQFRGAVPALWVMVPAMATWGLYRLLASDVEGRGYPGLVAMSSVVASATIVVLDLLWIPRYGIMGAAWASLVAYSVALALAAVTFCRVTGMGFRDAYRYRSTDLGTMARLASRLVRGRGLVDQPG